ncbi:hypothetical protein ACFXGI_36495 [Streptomyces sp. NPDC059355]|uniref:hypothetical protein n=1 Tax=Streptomyces sp. NPDC059355 TaxID=3346811 RepID=UPI003685CCBF
MKWRDSPRVPKPQEALDPYRFPGVRDFEDTEGAEDTRLASPAPIPDPGPEERPRSRIGAAHHRRLELHAALTAAGIPPLAGDLHAIEAVAALDGTTNAAVRRWIAGAR